MDLRTESSAWRAAKALGLDGPPDPSPPPHLDTDKGGEAGRPPGQEAERIDQEGEGAPPHTLGSLGAETNPLRVLSSGIKG